MSAEAFGAKLLSGIHQESLASLLSDLRALHEPQPRSVTGLSRLDAIIETYRFPPDDASVQRDGPVSLASDSNFFSENDHDQMFDHEFDPTTSPVRTRVQSVKKPKAVVIKISSSPRDYSVASASVLNYLISLSVLPQSLLGQQSVVVYIDCSGNFSTIQLYRCALSHAKNHIDSTGDTDTQQLLNGTVKDSLQHVHVIRCLSSKSLLQTLKALPDYLFDTEGHHSSQRKLGLLIIDQINHFYWQDRFEAEIARLEGINNEANTASFARSGQPDSLPSQILTEIKTLQNTFECTVVYTTTSTPTTISQDPFSTTVLRGSHSHIASNQPSESNTIFDIYARAALLTLQPTRKTIPQFTPHMTLEECLHDRDKRNEAVNKAHYWFSASPGGLSDVRRGPGYRQSSEHEMGFGVRVLGDGSVEIE